MLIEIAIPPIPKQGINKKTKVYAKVDAVQKNEDRCIYLLKTTFLARDTFGHTDDLPRLAILIDQGDGKMRFYCEWEGNDDTGFNYIDVYCTAQEITQFPSLSTKD